MKKFRKKPVVIEAVQCIEPATPILISHWCDGKVCGVGDIDEKQWIEIETLEGTMKANYKDWIIKGINGEFYPCKPDIFEAAHEELNEEEKI